MTDAPQRPRVSLPQSPTWLTFRRVEQTFWTFFILLPIFTGWLAYNWLPNESFNEKRHEMILSHEVCTGEGWAEKCGNMADVWRDKQTSEVYFRADFAAHRHSERWRMLYVDFGYGLVGCIFFAFARWWTQEEGLYFEFGQWAWRTRPNMFYVAFGKAVLVNFGVAAYMFLRALD